LGIRYSFFPEAIRRRALAENSAIENKIEHLAEYALRIFVFRGFHTCELCGPQVDQRLVDADGKRVPSSSHLSMFVPYEGKLFVAPAA